MDPVVSDPFDDVVLESECLQEDEEEAERKGGFERLVGPKAMRPSCHADHS